MSLTGPYIPAPYDTKTSSRFAFEQRTKTNLSPPAPEWSVWSPSYVKRTQVDKARPVNGSARRDEFGFRPPTPVRCYSFAYKSGRSYEYTSALYNGNEFEVRGTAGYPRGVNDLYVGSTGAQRYPIDKGTEGRSITECLNKIADLDTNAAESIATLDQTLGMLVSAVTRLLALLKAASLLLRGKPVAAIAQIKRLKSTKKGRRKLGKLLGSQAANSWLEYQYGWKPLMSDIFNISEELKNLPNAKPQLLSATRDIKQECELPDFPPSVDGALARVEGRIVTGSKCRIDVAVTHPTLYQLNRFGLVNPLQLAWELIPFSFVLDWLLPVGNYLSALSAGWAVSFKGASVTNYTVAEVEYSWSHGRFIRGSSNNCTVNSMTMQRIVFAKLPIPKLYMKNPFTTLTRLATALSLLQQLQK